MLSGVFLLHEVLSKISRIFSIKRGKRARQIDINHRIGEGAVKKQPDVFIRAEGLIPAVSLQPRMPSFRNVRPWTFLNFEFFINEKLDTV